MPFAKLALVVAQRLPNADEITQRFVTATVGLLAGIAYADRDYSEAEQARVKERLLAHDAFSRREVTAICAVLQEDVTAFAEADPAAFAGPLKELTDRWQRLQVLDVLADVAAADGVLSPEEDVYLKGTVAALELSEDDLRETLARHGL